MKTRWGALAVGVILLAVGVIGLHSAGDGTRSASVHVGHIPVEVVRPVADGARRPAVVVVHGYAGSGRLMRPFADTLVGRGYVVALPDFAGHAANTRPLSFEALDREIASVVSYLRSRPEVDPARVALLGHSMGAAAVVRAGAADPTIPATVAISLGDDHAAELDPGPRRLMLIAGAFEPGGILVTSRGAAGRADDRRFVTVPMVEHISVLFAGRAHDESARWLDAALGHEPEASEIAAARRVTPGALALLGALLLVIAALSFAKAFMGSREHAPAKVPAPDRWPWLVGAVVAAPLAAIPGGVAGYHLLPAPVSGYLVGYLAGAGLVLLAADFFRRRRAGDGYAFPDDRLRVGVFSVGLAVVAGAAVIVPTHAGLTAMVPHGGHWWMVASLALAVAVLLAGAQTTGGPLWTAAAVVLVGLPLPAAALVGLAPNFLMLISPLVAILFVVYFALVGVAWRARIPMGPTIAAGALLIAWPVATALPLG